MKLFSLSLRYVLVVADFLGAGKFVKILFILGIVYRNIGTYIRLLFIKYSKMVTHHQCYYSLSFFFRRNSE